MPFDLLPLAVGVVVSEANGQPGPAVALDVTFDPLPPASPPSGFQTCRWVVRYRGALRHLTRRHFSPGGVLDRLDECITMMAAEGGGGGAQAEEGAACVAYFRLKRKATHRAVSAWLSGIEGVAAFELVALGRYTIRGAQLLRAMERRLASDPGSFFFDLEGLPEGARSGRSSLELGFKRGKRTAQRVDGV